jgi:hypothetical protein
VEVANSDSVGGRRKGGHFCLLHPYPVILHAPDWEIDPQSGVWTVLEALPRRRSYLVVAPSWSLETDHAERILSPAIRAVRDRFDQVEVVVLASDAVEVEVLHRLCQTPLFCSHNALIREDLFYPIPGRQAQFDAIYDGKLADYKRHHLARCVSSLALNTYLQPEYCTLEYFQTTLGLLAHATWLKKPWVENRWLPVQEVNAAYNRARVGLCLSEVEGSMWASIQYLLAGLPVVTTRNLGGRDEFFSPLSTRWVDDDPVDVARAVAELVALDIDPALIRAEALAKIGEHRRRFLEWIRSVIEKEGGEPGRWAGEWPQGLPSKLREPKVQVDDVIRQFAERLVPEPRSATESQSAEVSRPLLADKPAQAADLDINFLGDGYIVYQPACEILHSLNHTAAIVLELCTGENDANEIACLLQDNFQLAAPPIDETRQCLEALAAAGLIA